MNANSQWKKDGEGLDDPAVQLHDLRGAVPAAPIGAGVDAELPSPRSNGQQDSDRDRDFAGAAAMVARGSSSQLSTSSEDLEAQARRDREEQEQHEKRGDVIWVEFEPADKDNPFHFSNKRKYLITTLAVFFTLEVAATASCYVPGIPAMERDLNVTNHTLSLFGISVYALGFSLPPLLLAPLTEALGRRWVFLASHLAYTLFFFCVGFANNMTTVLLGRFFGGAFGSTGSTLTGGLIADLFRTSDRGTPMALFATAAIAGTGIGPVWAGWVAQRPDLSWRWIQYIQAIVSAGGFLALALCLKETRGGVILTRRAARLRKETGDERYRARAEEERESMVTLISRSLTRPIVFLVKEPVVLSFSLWISTLWGVMYSLLESIGLVTALHGYSEGQNGLVFLSIVVAAIFGQVINIYQDHLYAKNIAKRGPEARLYMSMVAAILFPVGCFIYGWTSYAHVSIAGPIIGIIVLMTGVHIAYLAVFNFLADAYLVFASSALAAQSFARNMFGLAVPLFAINIYENLGYQWASSLAGFLGLLLGVIPFVLFFYGKEIRARSPASLQLQKLEDERIRKEEDSAASKH